MVIRQLGVTPAYNKTGQQLLSSAGPLKTSPSSSLINQVSWQSLHWTFFCNSKEVREKKLPSQQNTQQTWSDKAFQNVFPTICCEKTLISSTLAITANVSPHSTLHTPRKPAADLFISLNRSSQLQKNLNCSQIKD